MKKTTKNIISFFITVSLFLCMFFTGTRCYANDIDPNVYKPNENIGIDEPFVQKYSQTIAGFLKGAGIVIAVATLIYVGVKYMTAGVTEKAEYKKTIIPMIIGVMLIVFLMEFLAFIIQFSTEMTANV